jgi:hypothetical protein
MVVTSGIVLPGSVQIGMNQFMQERNFQTIAEPQ